MTPAAFFNFLKFDRSRQYRASHIDRKTGAKARFNAA